MKLLNCLKCHSIISLHKQWVSCHCGQSKARYREDGIYAELIGPGRIIGMINSEYIASLTAPIIPFHTKYSWFPIISKQEHHVITLNSIDELASKSS